VDGLSKESSETKELRIRQAAARSACYKLLSLGFLYPDDRLFSMLEDGEFARLLEEASRSIYGQELEEPLAALESAARGAAESLQGLQASYVAIFGHSISKECPPYEAQYGNGDIFQQAQALADIAAFYRAFGVEVSEELKDRLDHIAVELEFMHLLACKEAYALAYHGAEQAELCRRAQAGFMKEHLGRWVPFFAKLLARKAGRGFYRSLAELTGAFIALERAALGVVPEEYRALRSHSIAPEGACFECGVAKAAGCPMSRAQER